MPNADESPVLQIDRDHHSTRSASVATERDVLHEVEHAPWGLGNPGIEASRRVRDLDVWLVLVVDQPEAVLAVPQGKGLLAERTTDARDWGLFGSVSALVPLGLACLAGGCVSRTAFGLAAALLLASADQKGPLCGDNMGIYEHLPMIARRTFIPQILAENAEPQMAPKEAAAKRKEKDCRLPYEIRRSILIEAFGGRTLHMDLEFSHPLVRKSGPQTKIRHCDLNVNLTQDTNIRKGWQWFSSVCHRPVEWPEGIRLGGRPPMKECEQTPKTRPHEDICWRGTLNPGECGPLRGEDRSSKCFIGIMGWLLVCRQAYADGIDILFTTNTFYLKSPDLLQYLSRIILPQRLRAITSLEICWLNKFDKSRIKVLWDNPTTEDSELHDLCRMVPQAFPHVLRLDITLLCDIRPIGDDFTRLSLPEARELTVSAMERVILGPVESMLRALGPGREFSITVPMLAWIMLQALHRFLYGPKLKIEWYIYGMDGRFWKELDPSNELGYWICCGDEEYIPIHWGCVQTAP
ncbi:hypothetical protein V500_11226 [Pseudogymnoascus sp. VKM F-4518 (FW-2643)]|nr:hypothetical protein V500_11226 [Pseudogymnoascus sp. VKM F-4518 (FW-2643)]